MTTAPDYTEKIPNNVEPARGPAAAAGAGVLAAELPELVGVDGPDAADPGRVPAHRGQRRPRGLGALRARADAGLPVGHLPGRARPRPADRRSAQHKGEPAWQQVPGEYRAELRRLIVIQGDTEPAVGGAAAQPRRHRAVSLYDLRNLFQVNVEEGRHLWAMVYLLHAYFGRDGREEAEELLHRNSGQRGLAAHPGRVQRGDPGLAVVLHVHLLHRPGRQVPARHAEGVARSTRCRGRASSCSRRRRTT